MDEKETAKKILGTDVRANHAAVAIIVAKQIYSLARFTLHEQLVAEHNCAEENDVVEKFIVDAMNAKAEQPLRRDELLEKARTLLMPFMLSELEREVKSEETKANLQKAQDQIFKDSDTLLLDVGTENFEVAPGETILVFGTTIADKMALAVNNVIESSIVRYASSDRKFKTLTLWHNNDISNPATKHKLDNANIPLASWQKRIYEQRAEKGLDEVAKYLSGTPDLLIVNDLSVLCGNDAASINKAISALRTFCDRKRCALWVGMPQTTQEEMERLEWPRRRLIQLTIS